MMALPHTPWGWSLHRGWLWWCDRCRLHDLTTAAPNRPGRFHLWPHERCHPPAWTEKRVNIPQKTFNLKWGKVICIVNVKVTKRQEFAQPVFNPQIYRKQFLSIIKHFHCIQKGNTNAVFKDRLHCAVPLPLPALTDRAEKHHQKALCWLQRSISRHR